MAPKENCKVNCRPPDAVGTVGTQVFFPVEQVERLIFPGKCLPEVMGFFCLRHLPENERTFRSLKKGASFKRKAKSFVFQSHHFSGAKMLFVFRGRTFLFPERWGFHIMSLEGSDFFLKALKEYSERSCEGTRTFNRHVVGRF